MNNIRYPRIAIALHWSIAACIIVNLFLGFTMDLLFPGSRGTVIFVHASIGMSMLALVLLRIIWRVTQGAPELPSEVRGWERPAAHLGHFLLYATMVLLPLSGWAILSTNPPANTPGAVAAEALGVRAHPNDGIMVWGLIKVPLIEPISALGATPEGVRPQAVLHSKLEQLHETGAWLTLLLILAHIAAALKHQLLDRTDMLGRMGLGRRKAASLPDTNSEGANP